jgi:hypothetical protein
MTCTPPHDPDDPQGHLNALEAAWLATDSTVARCPHCTVTSRMLPMPGAAWGLDVSHEPGCPENTDYDDEEPTLGLTSEAW